MNSLLLVQKDLLFRVKSNFEQKASATDLELSKNKFVSFDLTVYMEITFTRLRYIHYLALDTFCTTIGQIVLSRIEEINVELTSLLSSIQITCTLVLCVYGTVSTILGIYLIKVDHRLATETFKVISPWVITNNPYLFNLLKTLFKYK